jgi:hypothetical protein
MSNDGDDLQWRKFTWSTAGFDARFAAPPMVLLGLPRLILIQIPESEPSLPPSLLNS